MGLKEKGVGVSVRVPAAWVEQISADIERSGETESAYFAKAALMRARGATGEPPAETGKAASPN